MFRRTKSLNNHVRQFLARQHRRINDKVVTHASMNDDRRARGESLRTIAADCLPPNQFISVARDADPERAAKYVGCVESKRLVKEREINDLVNPGVLQRCPRSVCQPHQFVKLYAALENPRGLGPEPRYHAESDARHGRRSVFTRKISESSRPATYERVDARHEEWTWP